MNAFDARLGTVLDQYRGAVGASREGLTTPALILDLAVLRANIHLMAERMRGMPARLRPHTKLQKNTEVAKMQMDAGAIGVCTATVWEAIVMSRSGIEDVLVANQVVGTGKIGALAQASRHGRLTVAIDDARNAAELSAAAQAAGGTLEVLIEVDVGMRRCGVRSASEAVGLARQVGRLPGTRLRGVQGYEGHCMMEPDRARRVAKARAAMELLFGVVDRLAEAGFACEVVSAGGTGTYDITGANPRVTEIQAGSYVFLDRFHGAMAPEFSPALTVLATVVSRRGDTVILDAGRKSVGVDHMLPLMAAYPEYEARAFHEEHALFDVDGRCPLESGDTTELLPGYAPTTVNLYDVYHVVENGSVVDVWPILPRGPGHGGLAGDNRGAG